MAAAAVNAKRVKDCLEILRRLEGDPGKQAEVDRIKTELEQMFSAMADSARAWAISNPLLKLGTQWLANQFVEFRISYLEWRCRLLEGLDVSNFQQ